WSGPSEDDGPQNVHVVLLDNGRTRALADRQGRQALRCIRCSACLNVCPVFEKVGGHAYGSVYPGPIGAILNPQIRGTASPVDRSLPFASTLCGACGDVCPVRIPIPDLLVHLRHEVVEAKKADHGVHLPHAEPLMMKSGGWVMGDHRRLEAAQKAATGGGKLLGRFTDHIGALPGPLGAWTAARDVPTPPTETFREWWRREHGDAAPATPPPAEPGPAISPEQPEESR
ncbi:MAG TPA: 4Fe-4S dicluster domain-containing protein, partial [Propionibacteriaceae bacterium]|nr:4Fe-4S dicluster domain-containing protein [Propionibacteriaceae bacterium]